MSTSLTPSQITMLRQLADGRGLPAYVLRPRQCAEDLETLLLLQFVAADSAALSIAAAGFDYLARLDSGALDKPSARLRVAHGRDQSISVEYWPLEDVQERNL